MQAQAAQLVGESALRDRLRVAAAEGGEMRSQIGAAETFRNLSEHNQRLQQRVNTRIGKAQA